MKKKSVSKPSKNNPAMAEIQQLHLCIAKDKNQLTKLYKKAILDSNKKLVAAKKALVQAKSMLVKAKKNKKKLPKDYMAAVSFLQSIKTEMDQERANLIVLKLDNKKFKLQQKAFEQIDKRLARTTKPSRKTKRKMDKQEVKNNPVAIQSSDSIDDAPSLFPDKPFRSYS